MHKKRQNTLINVGQSAYRPIKQIHWASVCHCAGFVYATAMCMSPRTERDHLCLPPCDCSWPRKCGCFMLTGRMYVAITSDVCISMILMNT